MSEEAQRRDERIKRLERGVELYKRKHFGERFKDANLCKLEEGPWPTLVICEWLKKPKNNLVILGGAGTGKTYFLASLGEWVLSNFNNYRIYKEIELLSLLRKGISDGYGDYIENLKYYVDDELIIIDDIGSSKDARKESNRDYEFRQEVLYAILEQRYSNNQVTILTSNFTKKEFAHLYPERVCSRLFAADNLVIELKGPDRRKTIEA